MARDLSGDGLRELAERIRARVAAHVFESARGAWYARPARRLRLLPFFREQLDALSWEQVISVADRALYVAKASGRNAWVGFHPGITALPSRACSARSATAPSSSSARDAARDQLAHRLAAWSGKWSRPGEGGERLLLGGPRSGGGSEGGQSVPFFWLPFFFWALSRQRARGVACALGGFPVGGIERTARPVKDPIAPSGSPTRLPACSWP